jgi:hypothetical protein
MIFGYSAIAQSVERLPVKEDVPGSSPGRGATKVWPTHVVGFYFCLLVYQGSNARAMFRNLAKPRGRAQTKISDEKF